MEQYTAEDGSTQSRPDKERNDLAKITAAAEAGYTGFTVDTRFSADTQSAVRRWQKHLGLAETGTVEIARVVYAPGPIRISEQLVRVGGAATGDILKATSTIKVVTAPVQSPFQLVGRRWSPGQRRSPGGTATVPVE